MTRLARRASLALLGLALGVLLAELVLRVAQPVSSEDLLPLSYQARLRRAVAGGAYFRFDQALGWAPPPGVSRRSDGVTYASNRAGLRADREYPTGPPPGVRRLAAFGESFTFCQDSNLPECWTTKLERAWAGTEVLNFGVSGYGPDQAWLRYQRDGPAYPACAVLIGYMVENINRVVTRFYPFYQPSTGLIFSKPRFVLDGEGLALVPNPVSDHQQLGEPQFVEQTLGPGDRWYFPGVFVANPLDRLDLVRLVRTSAYRYHHGDPLGDGLARAYRERGEAFQVAGRVLIEFARQVRRDGAIPIVVVFSPASEIEAALAGRDAIYAPLLEWLAREGVATIDVTDALVDEARRSGVSAVAIHHYTARGNDIVARTLARRLPEVVGAPCGV